mmetsp:Transcript_15734/g.23833  ORF Transcript_15734/g.23833 Transcript_15734/m.23833 type:complete len:604 (+) Transcript_15734:158-1969(+)|eukprot:CAMPEP_0178907098 /NCGR_PEP_ID=MMETSP0786-20121207/7184_1 /TAXON_ID=186022 /ORGANISM="Thalassionema frauenfeldii, Strain CCMP 1798" /LENGTH=603 /DNA_ID=CAMNT_0020578863 /DNA_START=100 /DNA_END=1911 /DNA_ORIENTATION=-
MTLSQKSQQILFILVVRAIIVNCFFLKNDFHKSAKKKIIFKHAKHQNDLFEETKSLIPEEANRWLVEKGFEFIKSKEAFVQNDTGEIVKSSRQKVPGCVANVYIQTTLVRSDIFNASRIQVDGEADALVSRGLLAVLSEIFNQMSPDEVLSLDPTLIAEKLGLRRVLSKGRNDGLANMCKVVQLQIKGMSTDSEEIIDCEEAILEDSTVPRVAVLLSGGVDSAVALNILKQKGYNITAFYLKIWLEDELAHLGQCPWEDDFRICEAICSQANIPLEAISLQEQYKDRVISYTINEAEKGRTPNPDIMCNSRVKFGCFYDVIENRGFDYIASGHYAQLIFDKKTGLKKLFRAPDSVKDQSYFLCTLTQQQFEKVLFPIGHLQKAEVRELAQSFNLPNKNRPDSQGLCFLGKVKFEDFLRAYLGERPGNILDATTGEILGRHKGVWYHTVGQRKGIGKVLDPKATSRGPWYVVSKDPAKDVVYISNEYDEEAFKVARTDVIVEDIHWFTGEPPPSVKTESGAYQEAQFDMKIRHGPRIVQGFLLLKDGSSGSVKLGKRDGGLAPGQFIVFYRLNSTECLGAGVISERHWAKFLVARERMNKSVIR